MRGRMFLPSFTGAIVLGSLLLARQRPAVLRSAALVPGLALVVLVGFFVPPDQMVAPNARGVANERIYYDGYSLFNYLEQDRLINRHVNLNFANSLRDYAETCGPTTIHVSHPGTLGFLAGSGVTLIDAFGLTDNFIAELDRSQQERKDPRPGHTRKWIPVSYLAERGAISIIDGWEDAVRALDCSFKDGPALFLDSEERLIHSRTLPWPG